MEKLPAIVAAAIAQDATDIHLGAEEYPTVRVRKDIVHLKDFTPLSQSDLESFARTVLSEEELKQLQKGVQQVVIWSEQGARFRVTAYRDHRGINLALRWLKVTPPFESLGLPSVLTDLVNKPHGLFLIVGPTGSGKTTTRSALIEQLNQTKQKHIITLEETIEHYYQNDKSRITQRTVGAHGDEPNYATAIRHAMYQDPDIISLGDLRDKEAMAAALDAAQTGHLIIAEVHASSTYHALNRIISAFPERANLIREDLAQQFIGSIAQRLIVKDGRFLLASEVLVGNPAVKSLLRQGRTEGIRDTMRAGSSEGMYLLEDHVTYLENYNEPEVRD
jgi:twitching motility protein PilT